MFEVPALRRAVFSAILLALTVTSQVTADSAFATATAVAVRFDAQAGQNIVDFQGTLTSGEPFAAPFLTYVDATGGAARWGAPTSAAFEESPGTLTQYFERGVIDWGRSSRDGITAMQPRLVWDHLGGGLGGSPDLGAEPHLLNTNPGEVRGPWQHRVSDTSVEGIETGFLQLYGRLHGDASFGLPKSDARRDNHPAARLRLPGAGDDPRVRQYFQAAVLEHRPDDPRAEAQLMDIGTVLRDLLYPADVRASSPAFIEQTQLTPGEVVPLGALWPATSTQAAVVRLEPSVIRLEIRPTADDAAPSRCGTAFFVDATGHAVTAWPLVQDAVGLTATLSDGQEHDAQVVAADAPLGMALISVDAESSVPVEWGSSQKIGQGDQLVSIGLDARNTDACPDPFIVTSTDVLGTFEDDELLDLHPSDDSYGLSPGSPVADLFGAVVGMVSSPGASNRAAPESRIRPVITTWLDDPSTQTVPTPAPIGAELQALVEPDLLFFTDRFECDAGSFFFGHSVTVEFSSTVRRVGGSVVELVFGQEQGGILPTYDVVWIGLHTFGGRTSQLTWLRVHPDRVEIVKLERHVGVPNDDRPFLLEFVYREFTQGLFIDGEPRHLEAGLPYEDLYFEVNCLLLENNPLVVFTNSSVHGIPLPPPVQG